jgi:hypothetical protein
MGIAVNSPSWEAPASLPEIKPAEQKQTVQARWNSEGPVPDWIF